MANIDTFKQSQQPEKIKTFPALLQTLAPQFTAGLPAHLKANTDRYLRIVLTEFRKNPKLGDCDPYNVLACAMTATQLGLEVGLMGQAYLIPYKVRGTMTCQMIPGYQGLIELALRSGKIDALYAYAVFKGDEFKYSLGLKPTLEHVPGGNKNDAEITHAYAVAHIKGSTVPMFEVMTVEQVLTIRNQANKIGESHYSYKHFEEYARKTAIRRIVKYLPKSAELVLAAELDESAATGHAQGLTPANVIEGSWTPEYDEPEPNPAPESVEAAKPDTGLSPASGSQGAGPITYAVVLDRLQKAKDADLLDAEADLIRSVADKDQRQELTHIYKHLRANFTERPA